MRPRIIPQDQSIKKPFFAGLITVLIGLTTIAIFWLKLPPQVPLLYSRAWGDSQLTNPLFLLLPLALSAIFLFLNSILAQIITSNSFLKKTLVVGAITSCILASITVIRIILLII